MQEAAFYATRRISLGNRLGKTLVLDESKEGPPNLAAPGKPHKQDEKRAERPLQPPPRLPSKQKGASPLQGGAMSRLSRPVPSPPLPMKV